MKAGFSYFVGILGVLVWFGITRAGAWDYEGHYVVNQLALASLPTNFPAFVFTPAVRERIAFLAGEPDRWRNSPDLPLEQVNPPDHYIDLEELKKYGLTPETLPPLRYDFVEQLAVFRAAHPLQFPADDLTKDKAHTRQLVGFLPWKIVEDYDKLKSCFSYLKAYQDAGGTPAEIENAQENIIYIMGVMGHFVGDGSQPLHTTMYFNGWFGPNPHGYTTDHTFHAWIDGGYFRATGGLQLETMVGQIHPAERIGNSFQPDETFRAVLAYLVDQNKLVGPLYQLEKDGALSGNGDKGLEGKNFLEHQLVKAGQMLGNLWLTAWLEASEDTYLERQLEARHMKNGNSDKK
ncbi:MAG: hypothetical protein ACREDQ_04775 [Limisphaerales bacterium]